MSYSCSDFTDSIIEALEVEIPEESNESPSDQADLCLAEIERLQRFEKAVCYALDVYADEPDPARLIARILEVAKEAGKTK